MNKNAKFILIAVLLVTVLALAAVLYPKLSQQYQIENTSSAVINENLEKAYDFTVFDADGNEVSLSDMTGKPTIVNFWTTWCGFCLEELPTFDKYAKEYKDRINFMMVDLPDGFRETEEKALAFAKNSGYEFPVYLDSIRSAIEVYQIESIPMTLLINKDGYLYKTHTGMMNEETLKQYIKILTEGSNED